jgi:hypothetical protein
MIASGVPPAAAAHAAAAAAAGMYMGMPKEYMKVV